MRHLVHSLLLILFAAAAFAQSVPATINYQGRLTDNSPTPVPVTATVPMAFAIYDAASAGALLWNEPAAGGTNVTVTGGIFNYLLGSSVAIPPTVFTGATSTRYLQITLNPGASQEILAPRQIITATGYANLAQNSNNAVSATTAATASNATNLGGQPAANYLLTTATAFDSARLGGTLASGWQKALTPASCPANQFYNAIGQTGTATCATPPAITETDPKVGTLSTGRVPYWNTTSLANGTMFDTGTKIGINTASPISPLRVAGINPVSLGAGAATGTTPQSVFVQGRYAYVANGTSGTLQVFDISNPSAIGAPVGTAMSGLGAKSVYVQGRYAYVVNNSLNTLQVFDISNPAAIGGAVGSAATGATPWTVYVQGRYAYVINYGSNTLQVFDISNPANIGAAVGSAATGTNPISIFVWGRYAYVLSYGSNMLQIFDISNPAAIGTAVGSTTTGSAPFSVYVQGRYAYIVSYNSNTLQAFDVSNPAAIGAAVGTAATGSGPSSVYVQGRYAYLVNGTSGTLQVFDISSPAAIGGAVGTVTTGLSPYSVYVQGRYAYVANYGANSLQAFDLGGAYIQQLETGGIETGTLSANGNVQMNNDAQVKGGLVVGSGGIYTPGDAAIGGRLSVGGTLSVGVRFVTCTITTPIQNCACAAGETVVSGGGYRATGGDIIRTSYPVSTTTWQMACTNSLGTDVNCGGMNIICSRLAP